MKREDMVAGRRYRVVIDGQAIADPDGLKWLSVLGTSGMGRSMLDAATSIEELPEPVEVFGPGDTVRSKDMPEFVYSIGDQGFYAHRAREWRVLDYSFTSECFERVDLSKL